MVRQPIDGELVVKVHSTSINPADWKTAEGEQAALLSFAWPRVIGFDFSGTVHQVGSDTSTFNIGDPVFGMIQGLPEKDRGTLQEYMVVNEKVCVAKPDNVTHAQAAAIPLVGITAVKMCQAAGLVQLALTNATNTTNTTNATNTTNTTNTTNATSMNVEPVEFLKVGLQYMGRRICATCVKDVKETDQRRFRASFGASPEVCVELWQMTYASLPVLLTFEHLLWAFLFLKIYASESVLAGIVGVDEKTY